MKYLSLSILLIAVLSSCSNFEFEKQNESHSSPEPDSLEITEPVRYTLQIEDALNEATFEIFKNEHFRGLDIYENTAWVAGTHNSIL